MKRKHYMLKNKKPEQYEYCIENVTSQKAFEGQCKALENGLTDLVKEDLIIADDLSPMQFYNHFGKEITVLYDTDLMEMYVKAPFDVSEYIIEKCSVTISK